MSEDLNQTNLAFFGTDLEKKIKEASANTEPAWHKIDVKKEGIYVWRIEKFNVVMVHTRTYGTFYEGDSYMILKIIKDSDTSCSYNIHFWLGSQTSIDEMGTAAYKTVELDNYLHGKAIQYREIQTNESNLFRSYFPQGIQYLTGGIESGFRKIVPFNYSNYKPILFMVHDKSVMQVPAIISSLNDSDVFILDAGLTIYIYCGDTASHTERYLANCTAEGIKDYRLLSKIHLIASDTPEYDNFRQLINVDKANFFDNTKLYKIVDDSIKQITEKLRPELLDSNDAFVLSTALTTYIWIGNQSNYKETMKAWNTAFRVTEHTSHITVIKDGNEPENFFLYFGSSPLI